MSEAERNTMDSWHSYPSIYALGHRAIADILAGPVLVQEKVDGSQFSFGVSLNGDVMVRSKGAVMYAEAPEALFAKGVQVVKDRAHLLQRGWTYRGEYLSKPKHNALAYDRIPAGHVILFDINVGHEAYLSYDDVATEARRIGLEVVPLLHRGVVADMQTFRGFLATPSVLGGQLIEGVVVKPEGYNLFGADKKVLMGKFVSESFKEVMAHSWKEANPGKKDIIEQLGEAYGTQARWQKAVQHLTESGKLEGSPRDIAALINEIPADIRKECEGDIKDALFAWAWPQIKRKAIHGMPEWYKDRLLRQAFEAEA